MELEKEKQLRLKKREQDEINWKKQQVSKNVSGVEMFHACTPSFFCRNTYLISYLDVAKTTEKKFVKSSIGYRVGYPE